MRFLVKIVLFILWTICDSQDCNEGPPRKPTEILQGKWSESVYPEGSHATYKCRPGYRTLGSIVMECKNGKWESLYPTRICMRKPCGHPGDIQFGTFELLEDTEFLFGSRVVYKCNEGYQLVSPINFRVCEAEGWSNDVPFCEVVKCSPVTEPENGRIVISSLDPDQEFTFGQVVQFECNPGFKLKGSREIHCSTDGEWNEQEPQCVEISCEVPNIENGKLVATKSIYKENERLQYTCNPGFAYSQRGDAVCTKYGWTPDVSCREVTCDPPRLANGRIYSQINKYRGDDEISFHCNEGYHPPITGNKAKCTPEGWSPLPRCNLRPCDFPKVENGRLYHNEDYHRSLFPASIGTETYYHCDNNYIPITGHPKYYWTTVLCTAEGWSPVPKCVRECHLYSLTNGHFWPKKGSYKQGDEIKVECHYGYSLPNYEEKLTCTKQGWSTEPRCQRSQTCPFKNHVDNGFFSEAKTYYLINTEARYHCKEGYATTDGKREGSIRCGKNGWLNQPKCIKICDIPQFENASYKGNKTFLKPQEKLEYECMDGYEITVGQTKGFKICDVDEWPLVVECYEKACELPLLQSNLIPNPKEEKYKVGDVLTFRCSGGLKLVGAHSVQCYHFGWSPHIPTCKQEVKCCEPPPEVLNGRSKDSNKEEYCHNDIVEYNCDLGFVRRGPREIQCNDGEWTTLPTCIEENRICADVPELLHGHVQTTKLSYLHGASVEFACDNGFTMVGSKTVTCNLGNWTQIPTCIERNQLGKCTSKFFENKEVILNQSKFNDIDVNYRCNWYSEIRSTKCSKIKWIPEPICPEMKTCAPPPQIPNAQAMNLIVNYQDGEKIVIVCNENYLLRGKEEIICKNGQWNSLPRCIEKQPCSKPPAIQYGAIDQVRSSEVDADNLTSSTYAHNSILNYTCQEGFIMSGKETITCNMGKWSSPPQCIGISCTKPPPITHGSILNEVDTYEFGEGVTYRCEEGFNIDGPATIKCIGGTWPNPPQCKDVKCRAPPQFENAFLKGPRRNSYLPGNKVTYKCKSGFQSEGSTEVICIGSSWKGDPRCTDNSCGKPPQIENGEIVSEPKARYQPGATVNYRCARSLKMYGKSYIVCMNKTWTELPQCKEELGKCSSPPAISNGDITSFPLSEYAPESTVEYRCQRFYEIAGNPVVVCRNGEWTKAPTCLEACTISEEIMTNNNIKLKWRPTEKLYAKAEEETEFECKWGYHQVSDSPPFRARCREGQILYPKCRPYW